MGTHCLCGIRPCVVWRSDLLRVGVHRAVGLRELFWSSNGGRIYRPTARVILASTKIAKSLVLAMGSSLQDLAAVRLRLRETMLQSGLPG
jgi:hypothetical protein